MQMRATTGLFVAVLLAGCSGREPPAPEREPKPVQATVTLSVPEMV